MNDKIRFKNYYFWEPPFNASARRREETKNSWSYKGDNIFLSVKVDCSCKNYHVTFTSKIDNKKVTIRELKKLLKS